MRPIAALCLLPLALVTAACANDDVTITPPTPPVAITENVDGTLTVNGLAVHAFTVNVPGSVRATVNTLSNPNLTVALSLGTWNGSACAIIVSNPAAGVGTTVLGTATTAGEFCVLLNDAGTLTASITYIITLEHF